LNSPENGDVYYQGDTVYVDYDADTAYMKYTSAGIVIEISIGGLSYIRMHPIHLDLSTNTVGRDDSLWGRIPIIIPDSVTIRVTYPYQTYSTVSDSVFIRVSDYGHPSITTGSHIISIWPKLFQGVILARGKNNSIPGKITVSGSKLVSLAPISAIAFYSAKGELVADVRTAGARQYALGSPATRDARIAVCRFADNTRTSILLMNVR
jgi:hypothetical protein